MSTPFPAIQFRGELEEVFDGASASSESRWIAADYYDKVVFATPSFQPIYWQPGLSEIVTYKKCRPVPGLPNTDGWDGVAEFAGHILFWRGVSILWSDLNDFANYIPVAITASTGRAVTASGFVMPQVGSTSNFVFLNERSGSFTASQFVRVVSNEDSPSDIRYSYFQVSSVSSSDEETTSIPATQTAPGSEEQTIYTTSHVGFVADSKVSVAGNVVDLVVVDSSRDVTTTYELGGASSTIGEVGESVTFPLAEFPFDLKVDDIISVSTKNAVGQDLFKVTVIGLSLRAIRLGVGETQKTPGTSYPYGGANPTVYVKFQPWVKVRNTGATFVVQQSVAIVPADGLKLTPLGLTGEMDRGLTVPSGSIVETLDANEAGTVQNIGDGINGPIFAITKLADYAYILKERSIQSVQYVGRDSGTFYFRTEIFEEGPIGKYAWCRIDEKRIIFWGTKGWYEYQGGQNIEEIGRVIWDTVADEVDRARADEIVMFHNKPRNEVWMYYPVVGSRASNVIVYNYTFNTVVKDYYPEDINGITAVGLVDWEIAPTWESLDATELINGAAKRWYEYVDVGSKQYPIVAIGGTAGNPSMGESSGSIVPRILAHGRVPYRSTSDDCDPDPVDIIAETPDYSWGDPSAVKYISMVKLGLFIEPSYTGPAYLRVQLGTRMNQDSDVHWSGEARVEVSGNGNVVTKVNLRGAGRYARLRFLSSEVDARWSISSFEISARIGNTF